MFNVNTLQYIGIACLSILAKNILQFVYVYFIGPMTNKVNFKSQGRWAVVTGCTDGIGKEYARQLAAHGCDIILISRSMDELKETADDIEKEFKVATKIVQVDFFEDENIYNKINKEIAGLEIGTLVNNVGVCTAYLDYFLEMPEWDKTVSMIEKVNMESLTRMTRLILPQMVKRGKGVIINMSSVSALVPSPMLAVYSATKAYIRKFTENLNAEYASYGIIIQCVTPGFVISKMTGCSKSSLTAPTSKTYVKSALRLVGTTLMTAGYLPHEIQEVFLSLICKFNINLGTRFFLWNLRRREKIKKELNRQL